MIDLRVLREDPDRARASQRARGEDPALVDRVLAADELRRSSATRFDELRSEQKGLGTRFQASWSPSCPSTDPLPIRKQIELDPPY